MGLQRLLLATDFSAGCDRALRRAALLAKQTGAALSLVHVIDSQRPAVELRGARDATRLLEELASTLTRVDGVAADARVLEGATIECVARAADAVEADIVVVGAPHRQLVRDALRASTVERMIREMRRPVLMACGVPAGYYARVLAATDLRESSAAALRSVAKLGLEHWCTITVGHVFDAQLPSFDPGAGSIRAQADAWIAAERKTAVQALATFAVAHDQPSAALVATHNEGHLGQTLLKLAEAGAADLIVIGSRDRWRPGRRLLGSLTLELLRGSTIDLLMVPAEDAAAGAVPSH